MFRELSKLCSLCWKLSPGCEFRDIPVVVGATELKSSAEDTTLVAKRVRVTVTSDHWNKMSSFLKRGDRIEEPKAQVMVL